MVRLKNYDFSFKSKNIELSVFGLRFFIPKVKLKFTKVKQVFIEVLILYYFDPESHTLKKIDAYNDIIDKVLNQLTLNNFG